MSYDPRIPVPKSSKLNPGGLGGTFEKIRLQLNKKVASNESVSNNIDIEFNELIKTGINVEVKHFFEIYEKIFYQIKKSNSPNKEDHTNLVHESLTYLNNFIDYCKPDFYPVEINCDNELSLLTNSLQKINDDILNKEIAIENTNLVYPNGTLLRGEAQNTEGLPVWIMVQGEKREIKSFDLYETIKRLLGHAPDAAPEDIQTTIDFEILNGINDGLPIEREQDIINIDITAGADVDFDVELTDVFNYRESQFVCLCGSGMGDPDEILPLNDLFKWGIDNNGHVDDGRCHIMYYDMYSQLQTLVLEPGMKSQRILHRTNQGDIEGSIVSVPAAYSDESTPILNQAGDIYHPEGNMFDGVFIKGFTREVRFSNNGEITSPSQGTETITAGDLNGDGISDDQIPHNHSLLSETYGENYAIYYYDPPLALSRTIKYANYPNDNNTEFMNRGGAIPFLKMVTDGEGGRYWPWPPVEMPGNSAYGTYGFAHMNGTIVDGEFSLSKIKERDPVLWEQVFSNPDHFYYNPNLFLRHCLINTGTSGAIEGTDYQLNYLRGENSTQNDINTGELDDDGSAIMEAYSIQNETFKINRIQVGPQTVDGGIFPATGKTTQNTYADDPNLGVAPLVFDVYQRYQRPDINGENYNANNGVMNIVNIYGAPIFEYKGMYYCMGRLIRDKRGDEKQYLTFCPLAIRPGAKNESGKLKLLPGPLNNNTPIMFKYSNDGTGGAEQTTAGIVTNTLDAIQDVVYGGDGNVNQIRPADTNQENVRCVFPGICTYYYQHHLNGWGSKPYPWKAAWDTQFGGLEQQFDLYHDH